MEGRLSRGSVDRPAGAAVGGRHEVAGAVPGAPRAECRLDRPGLVRLICEGWLPQDPCSSPGPQSRSGRHPGVKSRVAHSPVRGPVDRRRVGLLVARERPGSRRGVVVNFGGVSPGSRPPSRTRRARARRRSRPSRCACRASRRDGSSVVQAALAAPRDLHDTRVLACLASREPLTDARAGGGSGGRPRPAAVGRAVGRPW